MAGGRYTLSRQSAREDFKANLNTPEKMSLICTEEEESSCGII